MTHEGRVGKRGIGLYAGRRFKEGDIVGRYEGNVVGTYQVSTVGFKMDTSVFWASNMFIRPDFLLPQPPHHLKNM